MKTVEMASVENICWKPVPEAAADVSRNNTSVEINDATFPVDDSLSLTLAAVNSEDIQTEIDNLLHRMKASGVSYPLMAIRDPFSSNFVPKSTDNLVLDLTAGEDQYDIKVVNLYLTSLFDPKFKSLPLEELQALAQDLELSYSQEEIDFIEQKTREQSSCVLWYRFRAGRITGSVFKAACRTSLATPSISTVQKICFPERTIFKSKMTEYGKQNEAEALNTFFNEMSSQHHNYEMRTTGLIINNKYPFCGVSPDAIVSCDCCGDGVVEIKCPYLMRYGDVKLYLKKKDSPLLIVDDTDSEYNLKRDHEYYYQVQMEIFLAEVEYCDFVVWCSERLIRIRVYKDEAFWNQKYEIASEFFRKVLLPELYSCYYTRMIKQEK